MRRQFLDGLLRRHCARRYPCCRGLKLARGIRWDQILVKRSLDLGLTLLGDLCSCFFSAVAAPRTEPSVRADFILE